METVFWIWVYWTCCWLLIIIQNSINGKQFPRGGAIVLAVIAGFLPLFFIFFMFVKLVRRFK